MKVYEIKGDKKSLCGVSSGHVGRDAALYQGEMPPFEKSSEFTKHDK
jgi:hypothetical protein